MKIVRIICLSLALLPIISFANDDIIINNNTKYYGSAYMGYSPCSSEAGNQGILRPFGQLVVPSSIVKLFCGFFSCDVHTFKSKTCSGKEMITVTVNPSKGIEKVHIHDKHFRVTHTRHHATIDQVS